MATNGEFKTSHFHLAACLITLGYKIARVERAATQREVAICFVDSTELRDKVEEYWNGTLQIDALRHNQEYKSLMDRLNS